MNRISVYNCSIIELPCIKNRSGNITPIQGDVNIPFDIKRVFYLYDIPGGEDCGAHAHKACYQFLVAASGSFLKKNNLLLVDQKPGITKNLYEELKGLIFQLSLFSYLVSKIQKL